MSVEGIAGSMDRLGKFLGKSRKINCSAFLEKMCLQNKYGPDESRLVNWH